MNARVEIGKVLENRFRITRFIAQGGIAEVYEGVDEASPGTRVAIKLLHRQFTGDADLLERLRREAWAARAIRSPYVARVRRAGKDDERRGYIVFEFLDGESLDERLKRERQIPFADVAWMVEHTLRGLDAAHAVGVVHRDIKPSNLLLEREVRRLRVLDFGMAKRIHGDGEVVAGTSMASAATESVPLTRIGDILGTPAYMSPEQLEDSKHVDLRTDIYSVALVAHRLLAGSLPYEHQDLQVLYALKRMGSLPSLARATTVAWPERLEAWIQCAGDRDKGRRFESAQAALSAWLAAVDAMKGYRQEAPADPMQHDTEPAPPSASGKWSS